jgi:hypothetical protein
MRSLSWDRAARTAARTRTSQATSSSARRSGTYTAASSAIGMKNLNAGPKPDSKTPAKRRETAREKRAPPFFSSSSRSSLVTSTRLKPAATKVTVPTTTIATRLVRKSRDAPPATGHDRVPKPYPLAHRGGTREMLMEVPAAVVAVSEPGVTRKHQPTHRTPP